MSRFPLGPASPHAWEQEPARAVKVPQRVGYGRPMAAKRETWEVEPEDAGNRLGDFVRARLDKPPSARAVKRALEQGACTVDGTVETFASRRLAAGERVAFASPETEAPPARLVAEAGRVLLEDDALLVYDKPPGYPSAPPDGGGACVYDVVRRDVLRRGGPGLWMVHRLDRDTSGALVFVKDKAFEPVLREQFAEGAVDKRYEAIALGDVAWRRKRVESRLAKARGRGPERWESVERGGRRAVTRFERTDRLRGAARIRCRPETGRTHQIRVHLAELGHPILGDLVYGRTHAQPVRAARHMLHAREIAFAHPVTGARVRVRAKIPADFQGALHALRTDE